MSLKLADPKQQAIVNRAITEGADSIRIHLDINGKPYTDRVMEGSWGQSEIPISLDFLLAGTLERDAEDADTRLRVEVDGVYLPQMEGHLSHVVEQDYRLSTRLISSTWGGLFGGKRAVRLNNEVAFYGATPAAIAFNAARRLPYPAGTIQIEPLHHPVLTFAGDEGFRPFETAGAILDRLGEQAKYLFADTYRGFTAKVSDDLATVSKVHRTLDSNMIPNWRRPPKTIERFSSVVVYREDKTHFKGWQVEVPVMYKSGTRKAEINTPFYIVLNDDTDEGYAAGQRLAESTAISLARKTHADSYVLPYFDGTVQRGDYHRIEGHEREDGVLWHRAWLFHVDSYQHGYGDDDSNSESGGDDAATYGAIQGSSKTEARVLQTQVAYTGTVVDEDKIKPPSFIVPEHSPYMLRPLYGRSGRRLYFSSSLPWVTQGGKRLQFQQGSGFVSRVGKRLVIV